MATATRLVAAFDPALDTIEVRLDEPVANAVQLRMVYEVVRRGSGITLRSALEAGAKDRLGDREIAAGSAVGVPVGDRLFAAIVVVTGMPETSEGGEVIVDTTSGRVLERLLLDRKVDVDRLREAMEHALASYVATHDVWLLNVG